MTEYKGDGNAVRRINRSIMRPVHRLKPGLSIPEKSKGQNQQAEVSLHQREPSGFCCIDSHQFKNSEPFVLTWMDHFLHADFSCCNRLPETTFYEVKVLLLRTYLMCLRFSIIVRRSRNPADH